MARGRNNPASQDHKPARPPATTPEGREKQLVALAVDLAEKQLREGTASAQVISHYLKLGSSREQLDQDRLAGEIRLNQAKIDQITSTANAEKLYKDAIRAMRRYGGNIPVDGDTEDDYRDD